MDTTLRIYATKVLIEYLLEESKQQAGMVRDSTRLLATVLFNACDKMVPFGPVARGQFSADARFRSGLASALLGRYLNYSWAEIVVERLGPETSLHYFLDVLPPPQAQELANFVQQRSGELRAMTVHADQDECLSSLVECAGHLLDDLGISALLAEGRRREKTRMFRRKAARELDKSRSTEWGRLYISEMLVEILLGQVVMSKEVRNTTLLLLQS